MALFAGINEAKNVTFNGHDVECILFNGEKIFEAIMNVFKDGVLDPRCTMSGEFEIADDWLYLETSTRENLRPENAEGCIEMDMTRFSRMIVSGQYNSNPRDDGSCSIYYGFESSMENILFSSSGSKPDSDSFTLEIDVSDKIGAVEFKVLTIVHGASDVAETYDRCFTQCIINEIRLE